MPTISSRLREAREALGLSQQALADRCGIAARSQRNYEAGLRAPDANYMAALAGAGADILYILTGERSLPEAERRSLDAMWETTEKMEGESGGPLTAAAHAAERKHRASYPQNGGEVSKLFDQLNSVDQAVVLGLLRRLSQ